jgi:hypothetical protein
MTTKEQLHKLVDELSEQEAGDALHYIASKRENGFASWLDSRPEDDEPLTGEEQTAIAEGRADVAGGRLTSLQEIERELDYESE